MGVNKINLSFKAIRWLQAIGLLFVLSADSYAQSIPVGDSQDSIYTWDTIPTMIYYHKPVDYDSINGAVWIPIHGNAESGDWARFTTYEIADRRKILIAAPTDLVEGIGWQKVNWYYSDNCDSFYWNPPLLKMLYQHILQRENRDSIPVYFSGFSRGGQAVTRTMLIRQGIPDSVPIRMAVSLSPGGYTFCRDDDDPDNYYPYGIYNDSFGFLCGGIPLPFSCNQHIVQYYNENYGVMVGTLDTSGCCGDTFYGCCRYEVAQNFYNFSTTDAVQRGTTLKWQYGEVPGVGHDGYAMYNTILAGDSMPLAERLLFETPYHTVPNLIPRANFSSDTTIVSLPNATVQFYDSSMNAVGLWHLWDFGDSTISNNASPSHTYTYADTFTVKLTVYDGWCITDSLEKKNYIIVKDSIGSGNKEKQFENFKVTISPNPFTITATIRIDNLQSAISNLQFILYDVLGQTVHKQTLNSKQETLILNLPSGIYFYQLTSDKKPVARGKLLIQ